MAKWRKVIKKDNTASTVQRKFPPGISPEQLIKSREIIDSELMGLPYFSLGDVMSDERPKFVERYVGGFIGAGNGLLTLGVCVENNSKLRYEKEDELILAYAYSKEFYVVTAKIEAAREIRKKDVESHGVAGMLGTLQNQTENFNNLLDTCRFFIMNVCVLTEPQMHQRRNHIRIEVNWTVYFKITANDRELDTLVKSLIDKKVFEIRDGYFKTETVNISAGGFKSTIDTEIPKDADIECIIEAGDEKISTKGKVVGCTHNHIDNERFDMRVQFIDLPTETLEKLTNHIKHKIKHG